MIVSKTLLITILCFLGMFESPFVTSSPKDCESLKVSFEISSNNEDHSLDLTIHGGQAPYVIILSKESGDLVTEDFSLKHFDSLKSGKYTCVVIDKGNCKRKLEITIP
jgi:hypothetical protein